MPKNNLQASTEYSTKRQRPVVGAVTADLMKQWDQIKTVLDLLILSTDVLKRPSLGQVGTVHTCIYLRVRLRSCICVSQPEWPNQALHYHGSNSNIAIGIPRQLSLFPNFPVMHCHHMLLFGIVHSSFHICSHRISVDALQIADGRLGKPCDM